MVTLYYLTHALSLIIREPVCRFRTIIAISCLTNKSVSLVIALEILYQRKMLDRNVLVPSIYCVKLVIRCLKNIDL